MQFLTKDLTAAFIPPHGAPTRSTPKFRLGLPVWVAMCLGRFWVSIKKVSKFLLKPEPLSWTATSQFFVAMALATACVLCTHCIRGTQTVELPSMVTTMASDSGVDFMRASTASTPILQPKILSNADGAPPRWMCPNTVILVSCLSRSTMMFLTCWTVIGCPWRSMAPSATA